jgi:outer membrane protein OmpA-like peptidoglycan-associated protein
MTTHMIRKGLVFLGLILLLSANPANGQVLNRVRKAAKSAAEKELAAQIDRLVRDAIRCAVNDPTCYEEVSASGEEVIFTDENGEIITDDDGVPIQDRKAAAESAGVDLAAAEERPGEGVWANYDFVPGETVLFFDDYSADKVGDFPRRMEFLQGNWDVVEWQGRRLLRNTGPRYSALKIVLPRELPERFTLEFDAHFSLSNDQMVISTAQPEGNWTTIDGNFFRLGIGHGTGVDSRQPDGVKSLNQSPEIGKRLTPVRIMVDGTYAKVYVNERRVANVPNASFARSGEVWIQNIYSGSADSPLYLGPIRIAEGGVDLYDKLAADGRVATHGILFAMNSATIRPESTPTLDEIGTMMEAHPDLRLRIEGHTDATGDDASNLALSERRAEAVRGFLIASYGIDASRMEIQGLGETQPIDDNETPEGRQNNRRVELVKLDGAVSG